jgi:hypothetical protein
MLGHAEDHARAGSQLHGLALVGSAEEEAVEVLLHPDSKEVLLRKQRLLDWEPFRLRQGRKLRQRFPLRQLR